MAAQEQTPIVFTITVSDDDWDKSVNGWRCPALKIPSAEVADVFVDGTPKPTTCYSVWRENHMIRWTNLPQPRKATISFKITEALSLKKKTFFWQRVAALAPVMAAVITFSLSYLFLHPTVNPTAGDPRELLVFNLSSPVLGECGLVTINGSVDMPTGSRRTITRRLWDWGDGVIIDSSFPAIHHYSRNGTKSVKLTAYTSNNETEDRTFPINITTADDPKCH